MAQALAALAAQGVHHAVVDAVRDEGLLALSLPENFRRAGLLRAQAGVDTLRCVGGSAAVLAGSCSEATRTQVAEMASRHLRVRIDPLASATPAELAATALHQAASARACATPAPIRPRSPPYRLVWDHATQPRWWNRPLPSWPKRWSHSGCDAWWSPAAKRPARWSRHWAGHRPTERPRSPMDTRARSATAAAGAQVGQLLPQRRSQARTGDQAMSTASTESAAHETLCRTARGTSAD